jgi:hypothetical protein
MDERKLKIFSVDVKSCFSHLNSLTLRVPLFAVVFFLSLSLILLEKMMMVEFSVSCLEIKEKKGGRVGQFG